METSENPPSVFARIKTFFSAPKLPEQNKPPIDPKEHRPTLASSLLNPEWFESDYTSKK